MFKFGMFIGIVFMSTVAMAQTATPTPIPPDVLILKTGETYTVKAQMPDDADLASLCCFRVDAPNELDFGCVAAAPGSVTTMDITIPFTPEDDAEVRCTAVDTSSNSSDLSPNAAIADFTKPQPPVLSN